MILIGSRALSIRCPQALNRSPLDFDWICTQSEADQFVDQWKNKFNIKERYFLDDQSKMIVKGDSILEFEIIQENSSNQLLQDLVRQDQETLHTKFGMIPSLDLLFAIKSSHKFKKFHDTPKMWAKTFIDYHAMKHFGAKIRGEHQEFHKKREYESYTKTPSLNMNKEKFFSNNGLDGKIKYDHDDVHKAIAIIPNSPAYINYLKDGSEVLCDRKKFEDCDMSVKLAGVYEEAAVLSLERSQFIDNPTMTPDEGWKFAFAKICSSITGGFFRQFAYDHGPEILKFYSQNKNYYVKFQQAVQDGKVRRLI